MGASLYPRVVQCPVNGLGKQQRMTTPGKMPLLPASHQASSGGRSHLGNETAETISWPLFLPRTLCNSDFQVKKQNLNNTKHFKIQSKSLMVPECNPFFSFSLQIQQNSIKWSISYPKKFLKLTEASDPIRNLKTNSQYGECLEDTPYWALARLQFAPTNR